MDTDLDTLAVALYVRIDDTLQDHLGVPRSHVPIPDLRRIIDRPLGEILSNPEALDSLTGTRFEWRDLERVCDEDRSS